MPPLKARVENGRLVMDEPTDLPEGTELELIPANEVGTDDWADEERWSPEARERLEAALTKGSADVAAGRTVDAMEFLATLPE